MIDLTKAKNAFEVYVNQFGKENDKIRRKISHTYGVVNVAEYIANGLGLPKEDVDLAMIIALLHDIGRFEQAAKFDNFNDHQTMDHGEFGVELLFKQGKIREFIDTDIYNEIIKKAIFFHNKKDIGEGLTERELLHAKLIRDADKIDNYNNKQFIVIEESFRIPEKEMEAEAISDKVWEEFLGKTTITSSNRITNMDRWISHIAWIYDFNFDVSLKYIKENNIIDKIIDRLNYTNTETKERMEYARIAAKHYIDEKIQ